MTDSPPTAGLVPGLPLEAVLCTEELDRRPARSPNYEAEYRALVSLWQALADSPGTILQALADSILEVFGCGSAGISLVTEDEKRFYWPAVAGAWKPNIGGGTPRDFSPCGDVLDLNRPLLFKQFERRYTYFQLVAPQMAEALLIPFFVKGKAVGTIWAVTHTPEARLFDHEDRRLLLSLGRFASSAYGAVQSQGQLEQQRTTLREVNAALLISSVRQHELTDQAEQASARLARLQKITATLAEVVTPAQVAEVMADLGAPALGAVSGLVLLVSEDDLDPELLHSVATKAATRPDQRFALSLSVPVAEVMRSGQPIWIKSPQQYLAVYPQLAEPIAAWGHQAAAVLPLVEEGRKQGVLALSFDQVQVFSAADQAYALTLARLCAQALERARLHAGEQEARAELEMRVRERTADLEQLTTQLRDLSERLLAVREEERARVSREVHDQLGGALTALKMDIAKIQRHRTEGEPQADLRPLLMAVDDLVQMARRLATELRPSLLDHFGLAAAIEGELNEFANRSGIRGRFAADEAIVGLDPDAATAVFRIFQETLTNVARHAEASEVNVRLEQHAGTLVLRVHDNGRGIDTVARTNRKSLGLVGMRERVRLLSGEITFQGTAGQGTLVLVKIPLRAP